MDWISQPTVKTEYYEKNVGKAISAFLATVGKCLVEEGRVQLPRPGTLMVRERPARIARYPRTGEKVEVAACRTLGFRPRKELKERING